MQRSIDMAGKAMAQKTQKIMLGGQELHLKHLEGIMTKTQSLVLSRLLYYLQNDKFVRTFDEAKYVQKSLLDWTKSLEIRFQNGKVKKLSKSSVSHAFSALMEKGFVTCKHRAKMRCFGVDEEKILHTICANFACFLHTNCTQFASSLHDKTLDSQGLDGNSGHGTYTYTNTYTKYNKSHKSDKSDERTVNFSKNPKKDSETPVKLGDVIKKLQQDPANTSSEQTSNSVPASKTTIVQDMFEIWQEEFPLLNERLTREKSSWLKEAFDTAFHCDLDEFLLYLKRVKTSEFITTRAYLLNMKWLLNFENIEAIKNNGYGSCDPFEQSEEMFKAEYELRENIEKINESKICRMVRQIILSNFGLYLYISLVSSLDFVENEDGELVCYDENASINEDASAYANAVLRQLQNEPPESCDAKDKSQEASHV
jgi:hypothetical protein